MELETSFANFSITKFDIVPRHLKIGLCSVSTEIY